MGNVIIARGKQVLGEWPEEQVWHYLNSGNLVSTDLHWNPSSNKWETIGSLLGSKQASSSQAETPRPVVPRPVVSRSKDPAPKSSATETIPIPSQAVEAQAGEVAPTPNQSEKRAATPSRAFVTETIPLDAVRKSLEQDEPTPVPKISLSESPNIQKWSKALGVKKPASAQGKRETLSLGNAAESLQEPSASPSPIPPQQPAVPVAPVQPQSPVPSQPGSVDAFFDDALQQGSDSIPASAKETVKPGSEENPPASSKETVKIDENILADASKADKTETLPTLPTPSPPCAESEGWSDHSYTESGCGKGGSPLPTLPTLPSFEQPMPSEAIPVAPNKKRETVEFKLPKLPAAEKAEQQAAAQQTPAFGEADLKPVTPSERIGSASAVNVTQPISADKIFADLKIPPSQDAGQPQPSSQESQAPPAQPQESQDPDVDLSNLPPDDLIAEALSKASLKKKTAPIAKDENIALRVKKSTGKLKISQQQVDEAKLKAGDQSRGKGAPTPASPASGTRPFAASDSPKAAKAGTSRTRFITLLIALVGMVLLFLTAAALAFAFFFFYPTKPAKQVKKEKILIQEDQIVQKIKDKALDSRETLDIHIHEAQVTGERISKETALGMIGPPRADVFDSASQSGTLYYDMFSVEYDGKGIVRTRPETYSEYNEQGPTRKQAQDFLGMDRNELVGILGHPKRVDTSRDPMRGTYKIFSYEWEPGKETFFTIYDDQAVVESGKYQGVPVTNDTEQNSFSGPQVIEPEE